MTVPPFCPFLYLFSPTLLSTSHCIALAPLSTSESRAKYTSEYIAVRSNVSHIVETFLDNPSAFFRLKMKLKEMGWLSDIADPSEEEVVTLILKRIRDDPNQYGVFRAVLHRIPAMDLIEELIGMSILT